MEKTFHEQPWNQQPGHNELIEWRCFIKPLFFFLLLIACIAVACSEPEPETLPAEEIVSGAAKRMSDLKGFFFQIDSSGSPVFLDPDEIISLSRAEGYFVAPDRAQAEVGVLTPGLASELNLIGMGSDLWLTNFLTGEWDALPAGFGFNPALLFDSQIGIQSILASDLSEIELVGTERLDGGGSLDLHHISGVFDGARISKLSSGLIGPGRLGIQLWIAPGSFELHRAIIRDPGSEGQEEPSIWVVDFSNFDELVEISAPETN